jgi:hypothetical protein
VQEALGRLPESAWTVFDVGEDYVTTVAMLDVNGVMTKFLRTQYVADEMLQRANAQEYADSEGKRWKDGRVVARLPLNMIFGTEMAAKMREGDRDHLKHWLNSEAARPFRTFKGRV